jgi:hypothetical protein
MAISYRARHRLKRVLWAKTVTLFGIITGIGLDDNGLPPGGQMSDSSDAWLLTLKRLRREQNTAEAAVARKTEEHQATADAWASRVVRPAFATLAQHFNQGSDTRSLVVRPDIPRGRQAPEPPRGIGVVSGSPEGRLPVSYRQVGVEVVSEGRREFVYYLLISADEAGISVRKVVTDANAEQSEANAGVKASPLPPDISPATLTSDTREVLINDFLAEYARFYNLSPS